jgi:hypothetical protein
MVNVVSTEINRTVTDKEIGLVFEVVIKMATITAVDISLSFLIYKINVFFKLLRNSNVFVIYGVIFCWGGSDLYVPLSLHADFVRP